jgi:hypothetical protein
MLDLSRVNALEIFSALGFHPCPHHLMTRRQQMLKKNEQDEQASACFEIDYCIIMV